MTCSNSSRANDAETRPPAGAPVAGRYAIPCPTAGRREHGAEQEHRGVENGVQTQEDPPVLSRQHATAAMASSSSTITALISRPDFNPQARCMVLHPRKKKNCTERPKRAERRIHPVTRWSLMPVMNNRLDRPVDPARDHAPWRKRQSRDHPGGIWQLRLPALPRSERAHRGSPGTARRARAICVPPPPHHGSELARRAAELVEQAETEEASWSAHVSLMTCSRTLTEDDCGRWPHDLRLTRSRPKRPRPTPARERARG